MKSIRDILASKHIQEPEEVRIIKQFIQDTFRASASVQLQQHQIVISVASAALAGALRPRLLELKRLCDTDKRLVLRIGR